MDTVTIIDGEDETPNTSKLPIVIATIGVIAGIGGVAFGFIQKSGKDSLSTRVSNLEQSVNTHVAEVEALKNQLIENGIKPSIVTTTETKTVSNDTETSKSDKTEKTDKTDEKKDDSKDKKETAGEGYSNTPVDPGADWKVRFYLPKGIQNLNYIYPSENSISITGITTENKTYDSTTCASGFGQIILGGSTGEKLYSDSNGAYYYIAPSGNKCSGTDYETAVSLTKKLFQSIKAK